MICLPKVLNHQCLEVSASQHRLFVNSDELPLGSPFSSIGPRSKIQAWSEGARLSAGLRAAQKDLDQVRQVLEIQDQDVKGGCLLKHGP